MLSLIILLASCTPSLGGNTYYVATNGNDANPGTIDQPWKTIQKAADTLAAGDTALIRGGLYLVYGKDEPIVVKNSGVPTNLITIKSYPGETVTIQGDYTKSGDWAWFGILVPGTSYIKIEGLTIKGFHTGIVC